MWRCKPQRKDTQPVPSVDLPEPTTEHCSVLAIRRLSPRLRHSTYLGPMLPHLRLLLVARMLLRPLRLAEVALREEPSSRASAL